MRERDSIGRGRKACNEKLDVPKEPCVMNVIASIPESRSALCANGTVSATDAKLAIRNNTSSEAGVGTAHRQISTGYEKKLAT